MAIKEKFRDPFEPSEFMGLFSDAKPTKSIQYPNTDVLPFSTFTEIDSNGKVICKYIYDGSAWRPDIVDSLNSIESSVATNGSKTTIVDSTKNFGANILAGSIAKIRIGGVDYFRIIASNTDDTITIATLPGAAASCVYGDIGGGQVTIQYELDGVSGNAITLVVVVASGNNMNLSSSFDAGVLTVYLGTDAEGLADNTKNTGTAVAVSISEVPNFTATMTGSGGVVAVTVEPAEFSGGIDAVPVSNGCQYQIKKAISAA